MTWLEAEHGWSAAPEDIVDALSKDGFEVGKREPTLSQRSFRPARRRLSLVLLDAIFRECVHDILWRGAPPVLRFEPGHPALRAKHIQAVEWHLLLPLNRRGTEG